MPARRPSRARCRRRAAAGATRPTVTLLGEMFPGRSGRHRHACWSRWASPPARRCRRANGASSMRALDCAVGRRDPSVLHGVSFREFEAAGRHDRRLRRRSASTAPRPGSRRSARRAASRATRSTRPRAASCRRSRRRSPPSPINGRITRLRLRRLGAAGRAAAGRERRGRALCRHRLPAHALVATPTANGSRRKGVARAVPRLARAGPGGDATSSSPISPSAPRRWCRRPRQLAIPALYFTNLISARPLFGAAGAGSLAQVVNAAIGEQERASTRCETSSTASARATPPASGRTRRSDRPASARNTSSSSTRRPRSAKPRR